MKWTPEQAATARQEGWGVFEVIEHARPDKVTLHVLQLGDQFPSHLAAQRFVIARAQIGSKLHISALRIVVASRTPPKPAKHR